MQATDKLGGPFTPPGFYYKTFIRPRKAVAAVREFLRGAAGLGSSTRQARGPERVDGEYRHAERSRSRRRPGGARAAIEAARGGESVVVVDEGPEVGGGLLARAETAFVAARALADQARAAGVELLAPAIAIGLFEQGFVPVACGNLLLKFRAARVDRGRRKSWSKPLVFPGNDLIGVMLPDGPWRRLVNYWFDQAGRFALSFSPPTSAG